MTDRYGDTLSWLPTAGSLSLPYDYQNERNLAMDFTFYSQEGNDGDDGSDFGWTCPDGPQLTQRLWVWNGETDKPAIATLELNANNSQENYWGSGTFIWWYESDYTTPEEVYEGDWSLSANGEYSGVLTLDMTRTGGKRYKSGETDRLIHDSLSFRYPCSLRTTPVWPLTRVRTAPICPFRWSRKRCFTSIPSGRSKRV